MTPKIWAYDFQVDLTAFENWNGDYFSPLAGIYWNSTLHGETDSLQGLKIS